MPRTASGHPTPTFTRTRTLTPTRTCTRTPTPNPYPNPTPNPTRNPIPNPNPQQIELLAALLQTRNRELRQEMYQRKLSTAEEVVRRQFGASVQETQLRLEKDLLPRMVGKRRPGGGKSVPGSLPPPPVGAPPGRQTQLVVRHVPPGYIRTAAMVHGRSDTLFFLGAVDATTEQHDGIQSCSRAHRRCLRLQEPGPSAAFALANLELPPPRTLPPGGCDTRCSVDIQRTF